MRSNYEQAKWCLDKADDALRRDAGWECVNYWIARAQVYATLAQAERNQ